MAFPTKLLTKSLLAKKPVFTAQGQTMASQAPQFSLPQNYGFNDLAQYEEARRNALGQNFQNQIGQLRTGIGSQYDAALKGFQDTAAQRRSALSSSLADTARKNFQLQNPAILEDLNSRGLFNSQSAVANAQAQALKELEVGNQERLGAFDTQSQALQDQLAQQRLQALTGLDSSGTSANIQAQQDALDSGLDLRRGNLESQLQNKQASQEMQLARDLAEQQKKAGITNSLIGLGGNILPSLLSGGGGGFGGLFGGGGGGTGFGASSAVGGGQAFPVANGLGGAAGGLGSAIPLAGLALGGIAGYKALPDSGLISKSTIAPLVNPLQTAKKVGSVVSKGAKSVGKTLSKAFCFDPSTPILMEDGTEKEIQAIHLGDKTKGGAVESIRISTTEDGTLFDRNGVIVTGSHAVKELGEWIRVKDSVYAQSMPGDGTVFSLVTTDHRIYIKDSVYADEHETDMYEYLTLDQSLEQLNYEDQKVLTEVK